MQLCIPLDEAERDGLLYLLDDVIGSYDPNDQLLEGTERQIVRDAIAIAERLKRELIS